MARKLNIQCTRCHRYADKPNDEARKLLTVKAVRYSEFGNKGRTKKSRVVAWLCFYCLGQDPEWNKTEREVEETMVQ